MAHTGSIRCARRAPCTGVFSVLSLLLGITAGHPVPFIRKESRLDYEEGHAPADLSSELGFVTSRTSETWQPNSDEHPASKLASHFTLASLGESKADFSPELGFVTSRTSETWQPNSDEHPASKLASHFTLASLGESKAAVPKRIPCPILVRGFFMTMEEILDTSTAKGPPPAKRAPPGAKLLAMGAADSAEANEAHNNFIFGRRRRRGFAQTLGNAWSGVKIVHNAVKKGITSRFKKPAPKAAAAGATAAVAAQANARDPDNPIDDAVEILSTMRATCFKPLYDTRSKKASKNSFNRAFQEAQSGIVRRECPTCAATHKDIYYRRKRGAKSWDAYSGLLDRFDSSGFGTTFDIYSSFSDALLDVNRWFSCTGKDALYWNSIKNKAGLPGNCGPTKKVYAQYNSLKLASSVKQYNFSVLSYA